MGNNEISYNGAKFFVRRKDGIEEVKGYTAEGFSVPDIAFNKIGKSWSITDIGTGLAIMNGDLGGSRDDLIKKFLDEGNAEKLAEVRKSEKYTDMVKAFNGLVEKYKAEHKDEPAEKKSKEIKADFEIKNGTREGAYEIYFSKKPKKEILDAVKGMGFRWHHVKKCWYGFKVKSDIEKAIKTA